MFVLFASVSPRNIKFGAIVVPSVDNLFADKFSNHFLHCMLKKTMSTSFPVYAQHTETHRKLETSCLAS